MLQYLPYANKYIYLNICNSIGRGLPGALEEAVPMYLCAATNRSHLDSVSPRMGIVVAGTVKGVGVLIEKAHG